MLETKVFFEKAVAELKAIFGVEYLKANYDDTCLAYGMIGNHTYHLFAGIKSNKDLPERKATEDGWVVYAKILLEATTGKVKKTEYVLE